MKIVDARFVGSSTRVAQKPSAKLPEFAFIGRSNVGKSSLINKLAQEDRVIVSDIAGTTRDAIDKDQAYQPFSHKQLLVSRRFARLWFCQAATEWKG